MKKLTKNQRILAALAVLYMVCEIFADKLIYGQWTRNCFEAADFPRLIQMTLFATVCIALFKRFKHDR